MKPLLASTKSLALPLLVALAMPASASLIDDIPAGAGYAAWELCTRAIASGDDYWRVRLQYTVPKVQPLPLIWDVDFTPGVKAAVRSFVPTLENRRVAIYRPGLGCTLVTPDTSELSVKRQPFRPAGVLPASALAWPHGEAAAQASGLSAAQAAVLAKGGKAMFSETTLQASQKINTIALLVAQDGALVYEKYANGYQRAQPQLGWSMTKTLTSLIVGVMHTDGRFALDEPVGLQRWNGTAKAGITWRHLLNMAPGLAWTEGYEGASDATQMLFSQSDQGAWAADRPFTSAPGSTFTYSTGFANVAMYAMRQKLGGTHQALYDYYQARLFAPLGIRGGVVEPDASGTPVGGARGLLRPVDWLRLGQLVANHGQWQGQTLIDGDYMDFFAAASPASAEYGGMVWRQPAKDIAEDVRARLPQDLLWFAGHMGQFIVVVPSRNLVVLRMGVAFDKTLARNQTMALVADLLQAR
ncbi:serine hydrolase domain-containing protein [Aquabacterium sp.]|uniref:serine hydrolase domain-containing protein n=1 Tax=Aquabacterium sp. TaxID=1872578 RepID=UPI003D6D0C7C